MPSAKSANVMQINQLRVASVTHNSTGKSALCEPTAGSPKARFNQDPSSEVSIVDGADNVSFAKANQQRQQKCPLISPEQSTTTFEPFADCFPVTPCTTQPVFHKFEFQTRFTTGRRPLAYTKPSPQTIIHHGISLLLFISAQSYLSTAQLSDSNRDVSQEFQPPASSLEQALLPALVRQQSPIQGPGLDLVELNRRRFEVGHHHRHGTSDDELRMGELIEFKVASVPEQILANLPEDLNRQVLDSLATDSSLIMGDSGSSLMDEGSQDPDGASVERLTKSCLTVHASSARPEQLNVTFHLYTKNNPQTPYILRPQVTRLELIKSSPFDPNRPVKWITHGFHTNVDKSEWMVETKDKILAFEDANVILTDWRRGASPALAFYPKAAANAHVVAKMIVRILRRLKGDLDFSRVHLIGHSLGAHIMGFVGSAFTEDHLYQQQQLLMHTDVNQPVHLRDSLTRQPQVSATNLGGGFNQLIGRITACDPALPCFGPTSNSAGPPPSSAQQMASLAEQAGNIAIGRDNEPNGDWTHLRPDSAIVVEVMHSNPGVMGYTDPLGDYDFYPNGFERQPGCGTNQNELNSASGASVSPSSLYSRGRMAMGMTKRQLMNGVGSLLKSAQFKVPARAKRQMAAGMSPLDRFIKPIRDFFHGYTCSHHRSVELMVESMYYERVPQDRKLDKGFVCQMVGYRCADYLSFKKGFCFRCLNENDCRTFTMVANTRPSSDTGYQPSLADQYVTSLQSTGRSLRSLDHNPRMHDKFQVRLNASMAQQLQNSSNISADKQQSSNSTHSNLVSTFLNSTASFVTKRVLPTLNHYNQNYLAPKRNQYYFDTRPTKNYCIYHYHLYVKYRRLRIRESIVVEGFKLSGTLADITQHSPVTFNKFTLQSYTLLIIDPSFLGQIESLLIFGDKINRKQVEFIEITYMSNMDPRIRALGSARLCRAPQDSGLPMLNAATGSMTTAYLFVRCSGQMV